MSATKGGSIRDKYGSVFRIYGASRDLAEIVPRLYLGNGLHSQDLALLKAHSIAAVVNVTHNLPNKFPDDFEYLLVDMPDEPESATVFKSHAAGACGLIDRILTKPESAVLVHCAYGMSRSVAVICAYLIQSRAAKSVSEALAIVKSQSPNAQPNSGFLEVLEAMASDQSSSTLKPESN